MLYYAFAFLIFAVVTFALGFAGVIRTPAQDFLVGGQTAGVIRTGRDHREGLAFRNGGLAVTRLAPAGHAAVDVERARVPAARADVLPDRSGA